MDCSGLSGKELEVCQKLENRLPHNDPDVNLIFNSAFGIATFLAVTFIVIGGINFITSAGDSGKVRKAKSTVLYAVIGLIIVLASYAIVNFVMKNVTK